MRFSTVSMILMFAVAAGSAHAQNFDWNRALELGKDVLDQFSGEPEPERPEPPATPDAPTRNEARSTTQSSHEPGVASETSEQKLSRSEVIEIQQYLRALGYDPGPVDGIEGSRTRRALRDWQQDYGLVADGKLRRKALWILRERAAVARVPGTATGSSTYSAQRTSPSFDCTRATLADERTICASPDLAARDRALNDVYEEALAAASFGDRAQLVSDQRVWLSARRSCGNNESCLAAMMEARTAVLFAQGRSSIRDSASAGGRAGGLEAPSGLLTDAAEAPREGVAYSQAGAVDFAMPSLRNIDPTLHGGRLLSRHPFGSGDGAETVRIGGHDYSAKEAALALYVELAVLGHWPELIENPGVAFAFAEKLLLGDALDHYLTGCPYSCNPGVAFEGWRGDNEFAREGTYRSFAREIGPLLISQAPDFPIGLRHVTEVRLGLYDYDRQAFPLTVTGGGRGPQFTTLGSPRLLRIDDQITYPTELPVARDRAEAFLSTMPGPERRAYVAFDLTLNANLMEPAATRMQPIVWLSLVVESVQLFADPGLDVFLFDFTPEAVPAPPSTGPRDEQRMAGSLTIETWEDILLIGGRVAAIAGSAPVDAPPEIQNNLANVLWAVIRNDYDLSSMNDDYVLQFLGKFDTEAKKEIASIALQRSLNANELRTLESGGFSTHLTRDPFALRRAAQEIRSRLREKYAKTSLEQPVPLRVYCSLETQQYDFSSSSFPISVKCGTLNIGLRYPKLALSESPLPEPTGGYPTTLPMASDRAEAFLSEVQTPFLVSFSTEMAVEWRSTEAGLVVNVSYAPPSDFVIHDGSSPTDLVLPIKVPAAEPLADDMHERGARTWDASNIDHLRELAQLAGPAKAFPFDGRRIAWPEIESLGQLVLSRWGVLSGSRAEDAGDLTAKLFHGSEATQVKYFANAVHLPLEHIGTLILLPGEKFASAAFLILPDRYDSYTITAPPDKYARDALATRATLDVTGVHLFQTPLGRPPVLMISATPVEGAFTESDADRAVIERFDLRREVSPPSYELIEVPPRHRLVRAVGGAFGVDVTPIFENYLQQPKGLSSVEERERVEALLAASEESTSEGAQDYWLTGMVRLGRYDVDLGGFPLTQVDYRSPDMLRDPELKAEALNTRILNREELILSLDPEAAKSVSEGTSLPIRLLVRPRLATASSYGRLDVDAVALYGEILDENAVVTIDDPDRVLYRLGTPAEAAESAVGGAAGRMTRDEAIAFLKDAINENQDYVLIRRRGVEQVSQVLTDSVQTRDYVNIVSREALDMPKPDAFHYGHARDIAEKFRNDPNAAFLLWARRLLTEPKQGVAAPPIRDVLIALATEFDLDVEPFPPEQPAMNAAQSVELEDLLPGDAEKVVVRRRDDRAPVETVYTPKALGAPMNYDAEMREAAPPYHYAKDTGISVDFELPNRPAYVELAEIPALLKANSGVAAALAVADLERIFHRIADLDVVIRRFPPEAFEVGIAKDHKRGPRDFSVLGVSVGMNRAAALVALGKEFGGKVAPELRPGVSVAGGSQCSGTVIAKQGELSETGQRCVQLVFEGDVVSQVTLRQVIAGQVEDAVRTALNERYRLPFMTETRYLEGGGKRVTLGWGDMVAAERSALGRVDAKLPPTAVEAVLWVNAELTTVYVQVDDVPTVEARQAQNAPPIKF